MQRWLHYLHQVLVTVMCKYLVYIKKEQSSCYEGERNMSYSLKTLENNYLCTGTHVHTHTHMISSCYMCQPHYIDN